MAAAHPKQTELVKFADGGLSQPARKQLYQHLEKCQQCRNEVASITDRTETSLKQVGSESATRQVTDMLIGTTVGGYKVLERVGQGGMGVLYRAIEPVIGKEVAIKVVLAEIAADPTVAQRMIDEARAVNAARHKNIVDIFATGKLPDGRPFVVMELLQGQSLAELLSSVVKLPVEQAVKVLDQCFAGLEAAHAKGVIHRDLKPENIFVDQRTPEWKATLLDFGLATRPGGGDTKLTQPGTVVGTPGFMSPEQVRGEGNLTEKTDVYSMGVLAWTMLAGREPFAGGSIVEVMHRHLTTRAPSLRAEAPSTPPELEALVMQMLEKDPAARPTDAEVRRGLSPYLPGSLLSARAINPPQDTPRWLFAGLGVAAVVIAIGSGWVLFREEPLPPVHVVKPVPGDRSKPAPTVVNDSGLIAVQPAVPADAGVLPARPPTGPVEPRPKARPVATWRCDRIEAVSEIFNATTTEWTVFEVSFKRPTRSSGQKELKPLLVGVRKGAEELSRIRKLREVVAACKGNRTLRLSTIEIGSHVDWLVVPLNKTIEQGVWVKQGDWAELPYFEVGTYGER